MWLHHIPFQLGILVIILPIPSTVKDLPQDLIVVLLPLLLLSFDPDKMNFHPHYQNREYFSTIDFSLLEPSIQKEIIRGYGCCGRLSTSTMKYFFILMSLTLNRVWLANKRQKNQLQNAMIKPRSRFWSAEVFIIIELHVS